MNKILQNAAAILPLIAGLILAALPLRPSGQDFFIIATYYFLLAGSWNFVTGFAGQYSFAHAGLAAFGAYFSGWLTVHLGWPVWSGFIAAPCAGLVVGGALGLISMRVRGVQLSLITFAIASAFGVFLSAAADLTGGSMGMQVPLLIDAGSGRHIYLMLAGVAVTAFLVLQDWLLDGAFGLKMQAVRDDEAVAYGLGVNVYRVKVLAFAISAAIASFAGAFYGSYIGVLAPSMVSVSEMGMIVAMAVVGGLGRRYGALIGAFALQALAYTVRDFGAQYTLMITSGLSLLVIVFFREGLIRAGEIVLERCRKPRARWEESA
jgi:branched-chain amino acid transport system permease protein